LRLDLDAFVGLALSSSHAAGVIERFMEPGSSIDTVLQGVGYPTPITPASLLPNDNFTKMKKQYAEMGLGRSNTRFGWLRTRG
jgi:hypothetical protein